MVKNGEQSHPPCLIGHSIVSHKDLVDQALIVKKVSLNGSSAHNGVVAIVSKLIVCRSDGAKSGTGLGVFG